MCQNRVWSLTKLLFMLTFTVTFLAAYVTLERNFELSLDCKDDSFGFNVTVTATLASKPIVMDGLVCLDSFNFEKSKMQVLNVYDWFITEIVATTMKLIFVMLFTGIRWFQLMGRNNLLLVSVVSFSLSLIVDTILTVNCYLLFSMKFFKIVDLALSRNSIVLKVFEYVWFGLCYILVNVNYSN